MFPNKQTITKSLKEIVKDTNVQEYIKESKRLDTIRVHQAPIITYWKIRGETIPIKGQISQNGKEFQIYAAGLGYRKHLFNIALDELKDHPIKKAIRKVVDKEEDKKPVTKRRTRKAKETK